MNAVEIEEAISALAEQPFDAAEFPFLSLQVFGNKETTLKRLRKGESNKSDLGGVLQTNNIHIAVAAPGEVTGTLAALKASPATTRAKAKFVLATDGDWFEADMAVKPAAALGGNRGDRCATVFRRGPVDNGAACASALRPSSALELEHEFASVAVTPSRRRPYP